MWEKLANQLQSYWRKDQDEEKKLGNLKRINICYTQTTKTLKTIFWKGQIQTCLMRKGRGETTLESKIQDKFASINLKAN